MTASVHPSGHYRYAPGIEPYSGGVRATPGFEIEHVVLAASRPWRDGFAFIDEYLSATGLRRVSLAGVELRCPEPHTFEGFIDFNNDYRGVLDSWGLLLDGENPVARTNVAPVADAPDETHLAAFSVVVPVADDDNEVPSFVVAGAGDLVDQSDLRPDAIVGAGTAAEDLWAARVGQVLDEMEARLRTLEVGWSDVTDIDVYCAGPEWAHQTEQILARCGPAAAGGLRWYVAHPPITGLSFEMDVRGVAANLTV